MQFTIYSILFKLFFISTTQGKQGGKRGHLWFFGHVIFVKNMPPFTFPVFSFTFFYQVRFVFPPRQRSSGWSKIEAGAGRLTRRKKPREPTTGKSVYHQKKINQSSKPPMCLLLILSSPQISSPPSSSVEFSKSWAHFTRPRTRGENFLWICNFLAGYSVSLGVKPVKKSRFCTVHGETEHGPNVNGFVCVCSCKKDTMVIWVYELHYEIYGLWFEIPLLFLPTD